MNLAILSLYLCGVAVAADDSNSKRLAEAVADFSKCLGGYQADSKWVAASKVNWDPKSEVLPLKPDDAIRIACDGLQKHLEHFDSVDVWSNGCRLADVNGSWCYTIALGYWWKGTACTGMPLWGCVHVRLDGIFKIEQTPWVTSEPSGFLHEPKVEEALMKYRAYRDSGNDGLCLVGKLERLIAINLKISDQSLGDAITSLKRASITMAGKENVKIPLVLRAAALESDQKANNAQLSLEAKEISFIAAMDALCIQAGAEWIIQMDGLEDTPHLILLPKRIVQRTAPAPPTDPKSNAEHGAAVQPPPAPANK